MLLLRRLYSKLGLILFVLLTIDLAWQTNLEAAKLTLNWIDNSSNETGFKIERKTGSAGTYAQITIVGAGVTSYADTTVADATSYCYRVRAYNSTADSPYSNEVCATTPTLSDTTGPLVSITSHTNNQTVTSSPITVSGTASDSGRGNNGISSVTVNGQTASGGTASGSGTASWNRSVPLSLGANTITVVAKDNSASLNATTAQITVNYQLPLSVTGLTADKTSPQSGGTLINFTAAATGGAGPLQYKWWAYDGTAWSVVKNWSTSNAYSWTPTVAGNYRIGVWAKSNGNTADAPENNAYAGLDFNITPLTVTGLTADKISPQLGGTTVNFTALTTAGVAPIQFKWWLFNGTTWSVVKDWSTSNTYSWTTGIGGNYRIGVWARSSGNSTDAPESNAFRGIDFTVTPLSITGLSGDKISPQPGGTTINFTAATTSGVAPIQFKWWLFNGTSWSVVKNWSTSNSYSWTPTAAGNYVIGVWARSNGNTVDAPEGNAFRGINFNIGLNLTNLTSDKASPQPTGAPINFTATASGSAGAIQYKWWLFNGTSWSVVKDWSAANTFSWTPTAAGAFGIGVWGRSNGNTVDAPENNAYLGVVYNIGTSTVASASAPSSDNGSTQPPATIFVEPNGKCNGKLPCFAAIQQAVDSASDGAMIRVAQGMYHDNIAINASKNLSLEGGWNNTFLSRATDPALTVIDGDVTGDGIGDGSVLRIDASTGVTTAVILKGFTIQNGNSENGGGIFVNAQSSGSIVLNLDGNIIRQSKSTNAGGGIGFFAQAPGANIQSTLTNNFMYDNHAGGNGGAMNGISSNSGKTTLILINNTISNNVADAAGDGLYVDAEKQGNSNVTVKNSIIWGNGLNEGQDIVIRQSSGSASVNASYSDIGNALVDADAPGTYNNLGNNISADPLFVNSSGGDFHLGAGSPAIDRATSDAAPLIDIEGNARPQGRGYDMGADERL